MAYAQDPYPNQAKIEALADMLGVGTKTIVNWFHNHRMRNKHVNSPSLVPASLPSGGGGAPTSQLVKPEPEDLSNHSDVSTGMSASMSQWMFPSFEPVPVKSRGTRSSSVASSISPQSSSDGACSGMEEKAQDLTLAAAVKANNNNITHKEKNLNFVEQEGEAQRPGMDTELITSDPDTETGGPQQLDASRMAGRVQNKRKSSKPQWVYEGLQLDRSLHEAEPNRDGNGDQSLMEAEDLSRAANKLNDKKCDTLDTIPNGRLSASPHSEIEERGSPDSHSELKTEENSDTSDSGDGSRSPVDDAQSKGKDYIHKLQQAINTPCLVWDEIDRRENIEKLQKNLASPENGEENWEF